MANPSRINWTESDAERAANEGFRIAPNDSQKYYIIRRVEKLKDADDQSTFISDQAAKEFVIDHAVNGCCSVCAKAMGYCMQSVGDNVDVSGGGSSALQKKYTSLLNYTAALWVDARAVINEWVGICDDDNEENLPSSLRNDLNDLQNHTSTDHIPSLVREEVLTKAGLDTDSDELEEKISGI